MILKRFYDERLAQASYLIGCGTSGQALVLDANRDVEQYLQAARSAHVRITHVTETHIHADFVSGTRELAARAGATMVVSGEGGPDWQYEFGHEPNVQQVHDGDRLQIGNISVAVMHTPGHTPEHIIFFITDGAAADKPIGVITGDFVFVGDVGRPDLLERAAHVQGSMKQSARQLFQSLQRFKRQPDYLQIWPGHGAGSACGKGLSEIPHSTVGYERLFNWAFALEDEASFVQAVLSGQPEPPRYFAEMKRINRAGPPILNGYPQPPALDLDQLQDLLTQKATIIDTRRPDQFGRRHIPGTLNIPLDRSFNTWAGSLVSYERDFYLLLDARLTDALGDAVQALAMVGLDRIGGYFTDEVLQAWAARGGELQTIPQMQVAELAARLERNDVRVLDVRGRSEWEAGHLPDVANLPLGELTDHLAELSPEQPLVLHCQSGSRSAIAASLLRAHGFRNVSNLLGGFGEWQRKGYPVQRPTTALAEV